MRTFQEFLDICEELTGKRKERAAAIASKKTRPDDAERKKRSQAKWLTGRDTSLITKNHPSQGFGSHPDPKKSRAPKTAIANNRRGPGVKKINSKMNIWKTNTENVPGKGMPQVDTLPRGKGSKAARRAEALKNKEA